MHGACFDPGPRRGRGGALLGKPRRLLGGDVVILPGCRCLKAPIRGAVVGFGGSHVIPLCPVPLPVHFPLPLGVPRQGSLHLLRSRRGGNLWVAGSTSHGPFLRRLGEGDVFGKWASRQHGPDTPAWATRAAPPPSAGEGRHPGRGDLHLSNHPESCSSRYGDGVPQPCPSQPLGGKVLSCLSSCFLAAAE